MTDQDPFLAALPPATDPLTYLTILEYNLTRDNVLHLNTILVENEELTSEIGWDLVRILINLFPSSRECLKTVARLGNPREVLLKVAEAFREDLDGDDVEDTDEDGGAQRTEQPGSASGMLIYMLEILHSRIKTKKPSRFLSSSLQAIIGAASTGSLDSHGLQQSLEFIKQCFSLANATSDAEPGDAAIQKRLLQSFFTHLLEKCAHLLVPQVDEADDVPALAWSVRLYEQYRPARVVIGRPTMMQRLADDHQRHGIYEQVNAIRSIIGLSDTELREAVISPQTGGDDTDDDGEEAEAPTSPDEIPLSPAGCLILLAGDLYDAHIDNNPLADSRHRSPSSMKIFPDHVLIIDNILGHNPFLDNGGLGSESYILIDAALVVAVIAIHNNQVGLAATDEAFNTYLCKLSLVALNCSSAHLRGIAHWATTAVLTSHPSDVTRLNFIKDTLEHSPSQALKEVALGWFKDEILRAERDHSSGLSEPSIFATPVCIEGALDLMFPDISKMLVDEKGDDFHWTVFQAQVPFFVAGLNLYYLLLSSSHLRESLEILRIHGSRHVNASFLFPLRKACDRYKEYIDDEVASGDMDQTTRGTCLAESFLIENRLENIRRQLISLHETD